MTTEEKFFLQIISDFLHNRVTEPPLSSLNWDRLSQLAKEQQLEGILFHQCQSFIPSSHYSYLSQGYSKTLFYYSNRVALLEELKHALNSENIPYFLVKGTVVAKFYPIPALRTMGDSDLVVHNKDKERVHTILLEQGFKCHSQYNREWKYFKNKMEIELHHNLLYGGVTTVTKHQMFINNCWKFVRSNELDWSFHLVFLILHLRKHMLNSGVGFRQFMDIAVVMQQTDLLNWDWIYATLNKLGLYKTATHCFALIAAWFQIDAPQKVSLSQSQIDESAEKLFANGIFGFHDEENRTNFCFNSIRNSKYPLLKEVHLLLQLLFPNYETVRSYCDKRYSFVDGKIWLLPIVWIYRVYRGIRYRSNQQLKKVLKSRFISQDIIKKKVHTLENFGMDED